MEIIKIIDWIVQTFQQPSNAFVAIFLVSIVINVNFFARITDEFQKSRKVKEVHLEGLTDLYLLHHEKVNEDVLISESEPTKAKISKKLKAKAEPSKKKASLIIKNVRDKVSKIEAEKPSYLQALTIFIPNSRNK